MVAPRTHPASEIIPRRLDVVLDGTIRRYWLGDDAASTHMMNALSVGFPRGEKLFVNSVRAYKDRIRDPALADAVRRFVAQETNHSRAHEAFNEWLASQGLPVAELEALVERDIGKAEQTFSPEILLATTAALEHFTALLAHALIEAPGFLDDIDERVRAFWLWHALEEVEHKSVALDVYRHVGGRESVRVVTMLVITALFVHDGFAQQAMFMRADGRGRDLRSYARFARRFFGRGGHLTGLLAPYLAYYRRDFHPWSGDDGRTLRKARARLDAARAEAATSRSGTSANASAEPHRRPS